MGVIMRSKNADGVDVERAWFPYVSDGNSAPSDAGKSKPRHFLVGALPAYVDAFAITIHNSQGSEFDRVVVVLPEKDIPLMTRELLYTAITRSRNRVEIYGSGGIVRGAVGRKIVRHSGLTTQLKSAL
jgi:exodeoxyribonuclease V alpha subunit